MRIGRADVSTDWDGSSEYAMSRPLSRTKRQLNAVQVGKLIEAYRSGKTVYELGRDFGIHRATVGVILKRNDVPMRMRGLDESLRHEITRLREEGWSYYRLGPRFGVDPSTVKRFLLAGD
jgi:IS30 family transposase